MVLEKINLPQDLKKLSLDELNCLAGEIRQRLIEVVSRTGGHLASSLGAVELIIALHYCLNTPQDKIVFDVGHQAYAHKLLTGRNSGRVHETRRLRGDRRRRGSSLGHSQFDRRRMVALKPQDRTSP